MWNNQPRHVVQTSYDDSVFFEKTSSDTLSRQVGYGKILERLSPGSSISFLAFTARQGATPFKVANVTFIPLSSSEHNGNVTNLFNTLVELNQAFPIDTIATQTVNEDGLAALRLKKHVTGSRSAIFTIGQIHFDIFSPAAQQESFGRGERGKARQQFILRLLPQYDALRIVSKHLEKQIREGRLHNNIHVIPVPVPMLREISTSDDNCSRDHKVVYVGRLAPEKRLDLWLEIASSIAQIDPRVSFEIVGDGPLRTSLERLANQLGLMGRVTFRGQLPYDQLTSVYSTARVFLLTSSHEGFGRVLVEAYAHEVPAVAFACSGAMEIIQDKQTGFLHPFGEVRGATQSLLDLLNNDYLRQDMGKAGREYVYRSYSPENLSRKWVELLLNPLSETTRNFQTPKIEPRDEGSVEWGILSPKRATITRYRKLRSMEYSLLRALEYEALEGLSLKGRTLDIGGGTKTSYLQLLNIDGTFESINCDPNICPTYVSDLNQPMPFPSDSFDNVLSLDTFEHIYEDTLAIREALRVLKPNGQFHFMVPFIYRVHGSPYDYHRHTAQWWMEFLNGLGIPSCDLSIDPLVWDPDTSAAALIHWQGDPYFRKWLMLKAVKTQRRIKSPRNEMQDSRAFALGYYIKGRKPSPSPSDSTTSSITNCLVEIPRLRYLRDSEYKSKYATVARWLHDNIQQGTLLDIGARDRILANYLKDSPIRYCSADLGPGHDFQLDLEKPLPFLNGQFECVAALDVLEHLERIHEAFLELGRISKGVLIIGLPNMAVYSKRICFLNSGHLGTGKYDLLPVHQGDRHRWLTTYDQMNRFMVSNSQKANLKIVQVFEEIEGGPKELELAESERPNNGLYCDRCIYILRHLHN